MESEWLFPGNGVVIELTSGHPGPKPFFVDVREKNTTIMSRWFETREEAVAFMKHAAG